MSNAPVAPTDDLDMLDQMAEAHSRINDDQAWNGTNQIVSLVVSAATKGDTPPLTNAILDYGCGAGRISLALADRFPNAKVVGVDITEGMIEQSQERLAQQSAGVQEKVQFHLLSARSPTPQDLVSLLGQDETNKGYDLAVMSLVLGHIAPKAAGAAVVQSVTSTLKTGGKLVLAEFLYIPEAGEAEGTTEEEKSQAHHGMNHDHQHAHAHGHAHNHSGGESGEGKHHHDNHNHNHHDHNHSTHGHDHSHHGGHVAFTEAEIRALFVHCGLQPDNEFTPFDFEWGDKKLKCILAAGTKL